MSINKLTAGDRWGPPADEIDYHAMVKMGFQQKLRKNRHFCNCKIKVIKTRL